MTTLILTAIACATIITSIVNFAKPAYKEFTGKYSETISIGLSFILGIVAAFSVVPFFGFELNTGAIILIGLALGTGSNIFYDIWSIVKNTGERLKLTPEKK